MSDDDDTERLLEQAILEIREISQWPSDQSIDTLLETKPILTDASKEQIKLRSQYGNGLAISVFAVGVLGPIVALASSASRAADSVHLLVLTAILCFFVSIALHLLAANNLKDLDK